MITLEPIGYVRSDRKDLSDDNWGQVIAQIELVDGFSEESLTGLETFSHVEVIYFFHLVPDTEIERGARHPRGNTAWPKAGIFAQRGKGRPNRLGVTIVEIVSCKGRALTVRGLDAIDGSPVLDIKPVLTEFLPRAPIRQPEWSHELMREYWEEKSGKDW